MSHSVPSITSKALAGDPMVIHLTSLPQYSNAGLDDMTTAFPVGRMSFVGTLTSKVGRRSALGSSFLTRAMSYGSMISQAGMWKELSDFTAVLNSETPFSQTFSIFQRPSANSFLWLTFFLNLLQDQSLRTIN